MIGPVKAQPPVAGSQSVKEERLGDLPDFPALTYIDRSEHFGVVERGSVTIDGKKGPDYNSIEIGSLVFSNDGRHFAYIARRDLKLFVVVDGKEGPEYDEITGSMPWIVFSANGEHFAYGAVNYAKTTADANPHPPTIGPPPIRKVLKAVVVVDGKEGQSYDSVRKPILSLDGTQVAYVAITGVTYTGLKMKVVINGKEDPLYDMVGALAFSPDGKRVAYTATKDRKEFMVVDGKIGQTYDQITIFAPPLGFIGPVFSSNSQHLAYQAHKGQKMVVVVDGKESPEYDQIEERSPIFSPDSQGVAYVARTGKKEIAVLNGVPGAEYDAIRDMVFSGDGQRFAYIGWKDKKKIAVVDGKEGPAYDDISEISFSQDGKHVFYTANKYKEQIYVMDDKEGMKYLADPVASAGFVLSPDGRHVVFADVIDGKEGPEHEPRRWEASSPDRKHLAYVSDKKTNEQYVILDGQSGPKYKEIETTPKFLPDNSIEYLAIRDGGLYRIIQPLPATPP